MISCFFLAGCSKSGALLGYRFLGMPGNKKETCKKQISFGAGDEARTRYLHLGKVALYRMSYTRGTWLILAEDRENVKRNFSGTVNFFGAAAIALCPLLFFQVLYETGTHAITAPCGLAI